MTLSEILANWSHFAPLDFSICQNSSTHFQKSGEARGRSSLYLAILKFQGDIPAGYKVRALPSRSYKVEDAQELVMSGYGITSENVEDSGTLRFTRTSPKQLKKSFYLAALRTEFSPEKTLILSQPSNGVCSGDSGGALYAKDQNGLTLVGITSMVADVAATKKEDLRVCHGISLFVDVRAQRDWIEKSMRALN